MTNKYETIDLGNVKGDKGETGVKGRGIHSIYDQGYIDSQNPSRHYFSIRFDDGSDPFTFYVTDGEDGINMVADNTITQNSQNPVKSSALYTKFQSIDSEINALKNREFIHILNDYSNLPSGTDIDRKGIYLVPSQGVAEENNWEEYVWSDELGSWEHLGSFNINISNYYSKTEIDSRISTSIVTDKTNNAKFPSTKAVYDYITANYYSKTDVNDLIGDIQQLIHS